MQKIIGKWFVAKYQSEIYNNTKENLSKYIIADKKGFFAKIVASDKKFALELPTTNDSFFNANNLLAMYGIEIKNTNPAYFATDILYWFSQILAMLPLQMFVEISDASEKKILGHFLINPNYTANIHGNKETIFLEAILQNLSFCKNQNQITELLQLPITIPNFEIANSFTPANFEQFVLKNDLCNNGNLMHYCPTENEDWSVQFSKSMVETSYTEMVNKQTSINDVIKNKMNKLLNTCVQNYLDALFLKNDNNTFKDNWVNDIYKPLKKAIEIKLAIQQY